MYDFAHSIRPVQDKRLNIENELLKEILKINDMYNIDWIDKTDQIADSLTKFSSLS